MSDFEKHISAYDLIRWIKAECNPYGRPTLDYESGRRIIEHIKSMSSPQPEIIRCRDCEHFMAWRSEESAKKFGQEYECECDRLNAPKPDDFCSRPKRKEN